MRETRVQSLGREDLLEKEMATTPVFLPEISHGWKSLVGYSPRDHKESWHNWVTSFSFFLSWDRAPSLPLLSLFLFYIFSYLLSKTMGCFSGCLISSASIQKLFCGIYSAFKCSFDEFVREKVVSLSYSSAILGLPPSLDFEPRILFSSWSALGLFWFFSVPQCSFFLFNTNFKGTDSFCETCFSEISEITEEIS